LEKLFEWLIISAFRWVKWTASPLNLIEQCLRENYQTDTERLVKDYWIFPIVVSVAVEAGVLAAYNIDLLSRVPLTLMYVIFVLMRSLIATAVLFCLLRLFRIRADFGTVALCYTIAVVYSPVVGALGIPYTSEAFSLVARMTAEHVNPSDVLPYLLQHGKELQKINPKQGPLVILSEISAAVLMSSNVLVAECLAQALSGDRFRVYAAVLFSSVASFVPLGGLQLFQLYSLSYYIK
jgi:hypothetical protein